MARPRNYSDKEIIAALKRSKGLVFKAAERVGCEANTIYDRAKTTPAVAAAIRHQRGKLVDRAEEKLFTAINKGQSWAIAMMLKTLGKDRGYVERIETRTITDAEIDREIERELAGMAAGRPSPVPEENPGTAGPSDAGGPAS
jgi:hypothetical protein